jgi:hypothetical protein
MLILDRDRAVGSGWCERPKRTSLAVRAWIAVNAGARTAAIVMGIE